MFAGADLVVLNKVDLSPYVDFDPDGFADHLRKVNPHTAVLPVSATRGDGLPDWYSWILDQH
jgi:hydrogenase nickel incorporation protein HypB